MVVTIAFAVLLWWLGLVAPTVLVVVAVTLLTALEVVRPAAAARVERVVAGFGVLVGRLIGLVLLTVVNLFVFTPVAFFMWLFRYDVLVPGVTRHDPSFWLAHSGPALPKRKFADERTLWAPVGATRGAPRRCCGSRRSWASWRCSCSPIGGGWVYDEGEQRDARHRRGRRRRLRPAE